VKRLSIALLALCFFASCAPASSVQKEEKNKEAKTQKPEMVGNDKDEHGCIGSAGYVWSEMRHECIRAFELGDHFTAFGENHDSTYAAFVVYSMDKKQAEVYLPGSKPVILTQVAVEKKQAQPIIYENKDYKVAIRKSDKFSIISSDGKDIFAMPISEMK